MLEQIKSIISNPAGRYLLAFVLVFGIVTGGVLF